jgi:protein-S-isoprenylcysteine O-methyltransferase Ste14
MALTMGFLNYFQIALIIVVVCVIISKALSSWAATGVFPIVIGRGNGAWRIIELLSFLALILWVVEVVLHALRTRFDPFPDPVGLAVLHTQTARISGEALLIAGLIPFILAFVHFGTSWRIGIDRKTPGALVTGGIFAVTRNPIFVAFILFFFGMFLINGTWFFLIFALLAVVAIHFQILREEEFLKKQYGADYTAYSARTARYLIW